MKLTHILLFLCFTLAASCATEDAEDETEEEKTESLNGTWLVKSVDTSYDLTSDLKTGANTAYSTLFITESETDISVISCTHSLSSTRIPLILIKDNDTLTFESYPSESFTIISNSELTRQYEETFSSNRIVYEQTFTKISSTLDYDRGSLQLNGPISADNSTQVCLQQIVHENNAIYRFDVSIPLDNEFVTFSTGSTQFLSVGNYQYDFYSSDPSPVLFSFDVSSNADIFWSNISSNTLGPDYADLEITTSQANFVDGNFSFISQVGGNYTGTFSFVPF